jgi:PAS domain S-box-containing protein/diguanylate cyclase (GGDEF)-like protein
MPDCIDLLEAALGIFPDGIGLLDKNGVVVVWNPAAEAITGYTSMELLSRPIPEALEPLLLTSDPQADQWTGGKAQPYRGSLVRFQHKLGHLLPVIARAMVLRDNLGGRIGMSVVFHPSESLDALPHGEHSKSVEVEASHTDFEDRLAVIFEDFQQGGESFGMLWITVDQAHALRRTHGAGACDAMLDKVEKALANGLRPSEEIGRWGDDEYLILSHERTPELLTAHAQALASLARTADFRWWGDRVPLTVSIGAAQAERNESLVDLLERAKAAMLTSFQAGGNQITSAPGGQQCSPS